MLIKPKFIEGLRAGFTKIALQSHELAVRPRSLTGNRQFMNLKKTISAGKFKPVISGTSRVAGSVAKPKATA